MMTLNQARIVTTIFTGLVLFAEVNIPDWNAKANLSQQKTTTLSTPVPTTPSKLSKTNNIPQLRVALQHLKVAKSELENADDKELNSRSVALKETNKAIAEIESALKSDPKRSIAKLSKPDDCDT
jgi:hypothetical protein